MIPSPHKNPAPTKGSSMPPISAVDDASLPPPQNLVEQDLPDGGLVAWCVVVGCFLSQFCGYGYINAFGVYQAFYARQYLQNESSSAVSWIGSLSFFLIVAMGPMSGSLFDKGYFYHVYIMGAILLSLSIFTLSLVQPGQYYQVLLAQGLGSGIGQGLMYVPSFAILSHHFRHRKMAMMTIVASGAALGGIVNSIILNKLLNGPMGFKTSVRISAALITALLLLSCILMRTRYSALHQDVASFSFWRATKKCFTEMPSLLTIIGFTLFQVAYLYPFFYFQVDAVRHKLSDSFSFYSLVIVNAGSFFGRFGAGLVLQFISVVDLTIITIVACAVLIIGMIWLSSAASIVILGVLYGFFSGMNIAMMAPMFGLMSNHAELGVRMGVSFAITSIGGLIGPPICGALLTGHYLWWAPAIFCGAIALISGVLFIGVRVSFTRARSTGSAENCASGEGEKTT